MEQRKPVMQCRREALKCYKCTEKYLPLSQNRHCKWDQELHHASSFACLISPFVVNYSTWQFALISIQRLF